MNIQTKITLDESVVFQSFNFRVKICSSDWQWVIQKRKKAGTSHRWQSISYHRSKESLVRVYHEKTGDAVGADILNKMLPSHFGGDS